MNKNMNLDKQKLLNLILNAGGSKINKNAINRAKSGDISGLTASLDEADRQKLNAALTNKEKARDILNSKEAREIMKNLFGKSKNG